MSNKAYPVIGSSRTPAAWQKDPKKAPRCAAVGCLARAIAKVDIEVNWFRGDDEVANTCADHRKNAAALLAGVDAARAAREVKP